MSLNVLSNITKINPKLGQVVGRGALQVQKHSPSILTTVGVVGVVAAAVLASKATLKLEAVIDKTQTAMDIVNEKQADLHSDEYSSVDYKKDVTRVYLVAAKDLGKLYGPSVTLGVLSISCIIGGHGIMQKRNVASIAAYKTLEEGFNKYRARVVEELGLDKDEEFRRGFTTKETTDSEGKTVVEVDGNIHGVSGYTELFDAQNPNWKNSPEYNLMFVKCQETFANQLLGSRGHVFLNDVYDSLGMPRTRQGSVVGWVLNQEGDNLVDFRIRDMQSQSHRFLGTDNEVDAIMLDFNVDGIIWNKI